MPAFNEAVGALVFLGGTAVVSYVAVTGEGDFRSLALGAIISVVSAGAGWTFRGKVQTPDQGQVTLQSGVSGEGSTATVRIAEPPPPAERNPA